MFSKIKYELLNRILKKKNILTFLENNYEINNLEIKLLLLLFESYRGNPKLSESNEIKEC